MIISFLSSLLVGASAAKVSLTRNTDYEIPYVTDNVEYQEGQVIVTFKDDVKSSEVKDIAEDTGVDVASTFAGDDLNIALVSSDAMSTNEIMDELASLEEVAYVEPNYRFKKAALTNDTLSEYQWLLSVPTGQSRRPKKSPHCC